MVSRAQLLALGSSLEASVVASGLAGCISFTAASTRSGTESYRGRGAGWRLCCLPGQAPSLSHRSAAALWGMREPSSRAIEVTTLEEEPLAREHSPALRGPPSRRGDRASRDSGHDRSSDTLRPRRHLLSRRGRARVARVRIPAAPRPALAAGPAGPLSGRRGTPTIRECLRRRRELPAGVPAAGSSSSSCLSSSATVCRVPVSTSGCRWEGGRSRSIASGRAM